MKEIIEYQCEKCGRLYDDAEQCQACEEFHIDVDSVIQYKYNDKAMGPESKYPYAVMVKMTDGKELVFKR